MLVHPKGLHPASLLAWLVGLLSLSYAVHIVIKTEHCFVELAQVNLPSRIDQRVGLKLA